MYLISSRNQITNLSNFDDLFTIKVNKGYQNLMMRNKRKIFIRNSTDFFSLKVCYIIKKFNKIINCNFSTKRSAKCSTLLNHKKFSQ